MKNVLKGILLINTADHDSRGPVTEREYVIKFKGMNCTISLNKITLK